jgi:DNA-binding HxlR family transcriptional regulator
MALRGYGQDCSIARALEIVGERWTLLIVRNAMVGDCRFESLLTNLGIARNVLAQRLNIGSGQCVTSIASPSADGNWHPYWPH